MDALPLLIATPTPTLALAAVVHALAIGESGFAPPDPQELLRVLNKPGRRAGSPTLDVRHVQSDGWLDRLVDELPPDLDEDDLARLIDVARRAAKVVAQLRRIRRELAFVEPALEAAEAELRPLRNSKRSSRKTDSYVPLARKVHRSQVKVERLRQLADPRRLAADLLALAAAGPIPPQPRIGRGIRAMPPEPLKALGRGDWVSLVAIALAEARAIPRLRDDPMWTAPAASTAEPRGPADRRAALRCHPPEDGVPAAAKVKRAKARRVTSGRHSH